MQVKFFLEFCRSYLFWLWTEIVIHAPLSPGVSEKTCFFRLLQILPFVYGQKLFNYGTVILHVFKVFEF